MPIGRRCGDRGGLRCRGRGACRRARAPAAGRMAGRRRCGRQFSVTDTPKNGDDVLVGVADEYWPAAPSANTLMPVPSGRV